MEGIRQAVKEDAKEIYRLMVELENQEIDRNRFETVFTFNLSNSWAFYFVYERQGEILGFISIHVQMLLHHASHIAEIQELVVTKEVRGQGIGSALFEKAREVSKARQCQRLEVCCNQKRTDSHNFYLSQAMTNNHYKFSYII